MRKPTPPPVSHSEKLRIYYQSNTIGAYCALLLGPASLRRRSSFATPFAGTGHCLMRYRTRKSAQLLPSRRWGARSSCERRLSQSWLRSGQNLNNAKHLMAVQNGLEDSRAILNDPWLLTWLLSWSHCILHGNVRTNADHHAAQSIVFVAAF